MQVTLDPKAMAELARDIDGAAFAGLKAGAEQGALRLRQETRPISKKLEAGVSYELSRTANPMKAELIVSAIRPEKPRREAVLHESSGKTKTVSLRAVPEYDFAMVVAEGGPEILPRKAKMLLIPVSSVSLRPDGKPEAYIVDSGQTYIMRPRAKGMMANPYDVRAGDRLETEVDEIVAEVVDRKL